MIPRLYDKLNTTYHIPGDNPLGTIQSCRKCLVTEQRNGEYTIELETTVNDPVATELISQRIIRAKPNPHDSDQYFEIQSSKRTLDGIVKVSGKHMREFAFNLLSKGDTHYMDYVNTYNLTPQELWDKLFNDGYMIGYASTADCPFTFSSVINTHADYALGFNEPIRLGDILGGKEGSMLDLIHGEFKYNNYVIQYLRSRGTDTKYPIRYGKNISSLDQTENCIQTYSHVLPYGSVATSQGRNIMLYSDPVTIPDNECTTMKVFPLDCSEAVKTIQIQITPGVAPDYATPRAAMTAYAQQYVKSNDIGAVNLSITVDVRAELDAMQNLNLCDTVRVILDRYGVTTTAKIVSTTYNTLLERYEKLTIGSLPITMGDVMLGTRRFAL